MAKVLEGSRRGLKLPSRHLPAWTEKSTPNLSQNSLPLDLDLKPRPPEYEAEVLVTQPQRSVYCVSWVCMILTVTAFISLNSINQLIFVMVKCGVLFEVRTEFLNII
jgi:hypothetical protein